MPGALLFACMRPGLSLAHPYTNDGSSQGAVIGNLLGAETCYTGRKLLRKFRMSFARY